MDIHYTIFRLSLMVVLFIWGIIMYIRYVIKNRRFLYILFFNPKHKVMKKLFTGKRGIYFFRIMNLIMLIGIIVGCEFLFRFALDLPYIVSNNYLYVTGYTDTQAKGGRNVATEERSVVVKDEKTGEEIEVYFYSKRIERNTYITVQYLPHTRYGAIIDGPLE